MHKFYFHIGIIEAKLDVVAKKLNALQKFRYIVSCGINNYQRVKTFSKSASDPPPTTTTISTTTPAAKKPIHNPFMGTVVSSLHRTLPIVDMSSPKAEMIRQMLKENKVVIFSKSYCPYCTMAKEQFRKLSVPICVLELDSRNDSDEIQNILGEMTGGRTVPRCFIDGKFIGGGTDVKKMYELGTLQKYFS